MTYTKKKDDSNKSGAPTAAEGLRLALWFIDKIGDPARAKALLIAACTAVQATAKIMPIPTIKADEPADSSPAPDSVQ
jgi:hypothetical protein